MLRDMINGFAMALADSVPGVSGGTVAFIMGFYDDFIGSINDIAYGKKEDKKKGFIYLIRLGSGWIIGMVAALLVLASLFETHIYAVSSLFIGFIVGSIPLVIKEEKETMKSHYVRGALFFILGLAVVVLISYLNGHAFSAQMDFSQHNLLFLLRLFLIGAVAICAMFLPGISGSTLLLIFGAYIPAVNAIRDILHFDFSTLPSVCALAFGALAGALSVVRLIKWALEKYRTETVYLIIGMMVGSFYAIIMGPTTLTLPKERLTLSSFSFISAFLGLLLVLSLEVIKTRRHNS